ncbi:GNAT family N-acetyltransferase [Streptosporangium sp. NPDC000396]|uniref:GNAT family N-acetyltransferase n=1 Tax=Streptosporangium sp. NPDC000396 TaxID=3366185 RepID=UPI0036B6B671
MRTRAAATSDLAALVKLFQAINLAEIGRAETDEADIRQILTAPGLDLRRYSRVHEHDGRFLGFAALHIAPHAGRLRAHLAVAPTAPADLADTLLQQIETWARRHPPVAGRNHQIITLFQLPHTLAGSPLRRHGWTVVRRYSRLIIDLNRERPFLPDLPPGTRVRVAASDDDRHRLHMVLEDALAGHWNHHRRTFEEFWTNQRQRDGHDPGLWWIAEIDGAPAAALIARARPDRGWIAWLGTQRRFRGRGLGRFLLLTAFTELRERGCPMVGVDVDSANETNALGVYEAVGMRVLGQADQWQRDIDLGRPSPQTEHIAPG